MERFVAKFRHRWRIHMTFVGKADKGGVLFRMTSAVRLENETAKGQVQLGGTYHHLVLNN